MPAVLAQFGTLIAGILVTMGGQLLTERFIKRLVVQCLEVLVKKTSTDTDNKILDDAKKAWNVE